MSREAKIMIGIVAVIVVVMIGVFALANRGSSAGPSPTPSADKLVGPSPHKTGTGTKVTVVEFGDYQCPACLQAYPTAKQIISDYSDRITFVFRNYPLPQHPNAPAAAEVAEEAAAEGKFWQMHDKLYDNQNAWADLSSSAALTKFLSYANDLGLDANKVQAAVDNNTYQQRIAQDQADGNALGITGTPTFYVNGKALSGIPTYAQMRDAIDAALKS